LDCFEAFVTNGISFDKFLSRSRKKEGPGSHSHLTKFLLVLESLVFQEFYSSSASLSHLWLSFFIPLITGIFLLKCSTWTFSPGKISTLTKKVLPIILSG